jgi:hypothetical protein
LGFSQASLLAADITETPGKPYYCISSASSCQEGSQSKAFVFEQRRSLANGIHHLGNSIASYTDLYVDSLPGAGTSSNAVGKKGALP